MDRRTIREFRAHMATLLKRNEPIVLGNQRHHYALVIPLPRDHTYNHAPQKAGLRKAQAATNAAFRELRAAHE